MVLPSLHRSHIGGLYEDLEMLAEVIRAKCERARHRHESVVVLADDDGLVYAAQMGSGTTTLALIRHPHWHVATYSHAYDYLRKCAPTVREIADDLLERRRELKRAA
jgi:hypothetical protein